MKKKWILEMQKWILRMKKVDIESVLTEKDSNFSVKTTVHIHRLFCECYPNSWPQEMREV
jgi:hypothetical protein